MSDSATTPAQDTATPSIDTQQLQQPPPPQSLVQDPQLHAQLHQNSQPTISDAPRKPKAPAVRRACTSCHSGKTRCSEILPCQSCLKRGLGATCAYPDPEAPVDHSQQQTPGSSSLISFVPMSAEATLTHQQYYEYNGSFTGASTSTFRPNKRPRPLTEEEAAAITRNFSRGDFISALRHLFGSTHVCQYGSLWGRGPRTLHDRRDAGV
ncbi:hypothetical protein BJV77DRAFT_969352, partial [Russula vinacea]